MTGPSITVETTVEKDLDTVWTAWTEAEHITQWNFASNDWCCPSAVNDLRPGGAFSWRMEAKDGSMGFDYAGTYDEIDPRRRLKKTLEDGRTVEISFQDLGGSTKVIETFEADGENVEMQRQGWRAILENFRKHADGLTL